MGVRIPPRAPTWSSRSSHYQEELRVLRRRPREEVDDRSSARVAPHRREHRTLVSEPDRLALDEAMSGVEGDVARPSKYQDGGSCGCTLSIFVSALRIRGVKRPDQRSNPGSNRSCCIIGIFHLSGGIQIAAASASSVIHVSSCGNPMCGPTKLKNPWRRARRVLAFGKNHENVGSSSNADAYVAAMRSLSRRVALRICSMDQYLPKKTSHPRSLCVAATPGGTGCRDTSCWSTGPSTVWRRWNRPLIASITEARSPKPLVARSSMSGGRRE